MLNSQLMMALVQIINPQNNFIFHRRLLSVTWLAHEGACSYDHEHGEQRPAGARRATAGGTPLILQSDGSFAPRPTPLATVSTPLAITFSTNSTTASTTSTSAKSKVSTASPFALRSVTSGLPSAAVSSTALVTICSVVSPPAMGPVITYI
ncbi:hypothetical protein BJ165DRAFT_264389 [Panaeolus papilionaceus]|nr:hypothetical protein BJ165DRAFT_264389 [Panaeolus papilionaceus]